MVGHFLPGQKRPRRCTHPTSHRAKAIPRFPAQASTISFSDIGPRLWFGAREAIENKLIILLRVNAIAGRGYETREGNWKIVTKSYTDNQTGKTVHFRNKKKVFIRNLFALTIQHYYVWRFFRRK